MIFITGCLHFTAEPIQPRRPIYVLGRAYKLKHLYRDTFTAASLGDRPHYCYRQTPKFSSGLYLQGPAMGFRRLITMPCAHQEFQSPILWPQLTPTPGSSSLVQSPRISGNHNLLTGKCIGNVQGVQTHSGQPKTTGNPLASLEHMSGTRTLVHKVKITESNRIHEQF